MESYLMGKSILLDATTIASNLGLEDEGVDDETTQIPFVHASGSIVSILDTHDHFLQLISLGGFDHPVENSPRFVGLTLFGSIAFVKMGGDPRISAFLEEDNMF
ncbi:hypothetical protein GQ457_06G013170 [Hibiscus cannabinus]